MGQEKLFVLGAGSSLEYGYPTGRDLINRITNELELYVGQLSSVEFYASDLFEDLKELVSSASELKNALLSWAGPTSYIDKFLSNNSPKFDSIGKFAIALIILKCEHQLSRGNYSLYQNNGDNWQRYLFDEFTSQHITSDLGELELNGRFITFNYDRSFEHAFYRFIKSQYHNATEDVINGLLKVKHIYGCVKTASPSDRYGTDPNYMEVIEAAKNINVMYQDRNMDSHFSTILDLDLARFSEIYFLGFAFHDVNMKMLGFPQSLPSDAKIYGTAHGLPPKRKAAIEKNLMPQILFKDCSCIELLKEYL